MGDRSFLKLFGMDGLLHLHSFSKKGGGGRIGRKKTEKFHRHTKPRCGGYEGQIWQYTVSGTWTTCKF